MAEITIRNLEKRYGALKVVHNINLDIADEEFVVFVGPSGCGKSTTLRMIAGLESISSGTISIGGRVVNDLPPRDRDIAMVFQNYALYQHMTVYDNLAFGLRNRSVPEDRIRAEVERATGILGLGPLLQRKPFQLSGGQQQRVALGRCIVRHPQVFLFDEPLSNLDAKLRAQMRIELKALRERVPTTSIYVTHDQVEAMTLGDRVVVMKDGLIQQVGTPLEIYNSPANRFVAGFMGAPAMNFLEVEAVQENGQLYAQAEGFKIPVPAPAAQRISQYGSRELTIGIRPEHICVGEAPDGCRTGFTGRVEVTEQLGAELVIGAQTANTLIMVSRVPPQSKIPLHAAIPFWLKEDALHFFDRRSEAAI